MQPMMQPGAPAPAALPQAPVLPPWMQAARSAWNATPWWQKGAVSVGNGAANIDRSDVVSPLMHLGAHLGMVDPARVAAYDNATKQGNQIFGAVPGVLPRVGSTIGEIGAVAPFAAAGDGLASLGERGLLAMLGEDAAPVARGAASLAPKIGTGAAAGALSPEDRSIGAIAGGMFPVAGLLGGLGMRLAGQGLLRTGIPMGLAGKIPFEVMHKLVADAPDMADAIAQGYHDIVPKMAQDAARPVLKIGSDLAKHPAKSIARTALRSVLARSQQKNTTQSSGGQ